MIQPLPQAPTGYAAVLIDFENLYYHLSGQYVDHPDLSDVLFDLLRNLRAHLEDELHLQPIIQMAYADFERLKSTPQGSLYLMGIDTHNVLSTEHKNAADMRLCIDAMEVLYTRPEITTFVFVAGDRDYIPVVQHLRRQARSVLVAAFKGNTSGDLLLNVGEKNFIEASALIDPKMIARLELAAMKQKEVEDAIRLRAARPVTPPLETAHAAVTSPAPPPVTRHAMPQRPVAVREPSFAPAQKVSDENQITCLRVMLDHFGQFNEIFLSPFLRKFSDALPRLADFERKALLNDLEAAGAIRIEKRKGEPFDYSVIVVNYNHPTVRDVNPG
jgi:hypothetical protein